MFISAARAAFYPNIYAKGQFELRFDIFKKSRPFDEFSSSVVTYCFFLLTSVDLASNRSLGIL